MKSSFFCLLRRFCLPLFCLPLLVAACGIPGACAQTAPGSLAPRDPAYFRYDARAPFAVSETPQPSPAGMRIVRVTFPTPVPSPVPVNNTVTGFLFLPTGPGPHPAMLVLHEWLPVNLNDEYTLCEAIARNHIAAFLMVEPYSFMRRPSPRVPFREILSGNVPRMKEALRQTVLDSRRCFDYLSRRPDIDPQRLGVSGISLGGVLAPLIAGVDRRAKVLLTFVGGADVGGEVWENIMFQGFRAEFRREGYTEDTLRVALADFDAARWLSGFDPKNALLFNGRYDIFVTPSKAKILSRDLGGAAIIWSNTGHYGLHLSLARAEELGGEFLRSRFFADAPPFTPPNTIPAPTLKLGFLLGGHEGLSPAFAYQVVNFDRPGAVSLDAQLTTHGLSAALSARLSLTTSIGLEMPLLHRDRKIAPFFLLHLVP